MSARRHQAKRRRNYGRRQHELHERMGDIVAAIERLDESRTRDTTYIWDRMTGLHGNGKAWPAPQGIE